MSIKQREICRKTERQRNEVGKSKELIKRKERTREFPGQSCSITYVKDKKSYRPKDGPTFASQFEKYLQFKCDEIEYHCRSDGFILHKSK